MNLGRWLRNHPALLEKLYRLTAALFRCTEPLLSRLGHERVERRLRGSEALVKQILFDCRMCGQCVLHSTGMTCPMSCPKNLRNGPCGGVRANGHCEVIPEMRCVWVEAYERSTQMPRYGSEMMLLNPPVNWQLEGQSAWINMITGKDVQVPAGWVGLSTIATIPEGSYPRGE